MERPLRSHRFLCPSGSSKKAAAVRWRNALRKRRRRRSSTPLGHSLVYEAIAEGHRQAGKRASEVLFVFARAAGERNPYRRHPHPIRIPAFHPRDNVIIVTAPISRQGPTMGLKRIVGRIHIAAPGFGIATQISVLEAEDNGGHERRSDVPPPRRPRLRLAALVKRAGGTAASPKTLTGAQIRDHLFQHARSRNTLQPDVEQGPAVLDCGAAVSRDLALSLVRRGGRPPRAPPRTSSRGP